MDSELLTQYFKEITLGKPNILQQIIEIFYETGHVNEERLYLYYIKDRLPGVSFKTPHGIKMVKNEFDIVKSIVEPMKEALSYDDNLHYKIPGILNIKPFVVGQFLFFYTHKSIDEKGQEILHISPYKTQIIDWVDAWIKSIESNPDIWSHYNELEYRIYLADQIVTDIKTSL